MNNSVDEREVIARLRPTMARRVLSVGMPGLLGVLLINVAITAPPAPGWQVFLIGLGAGALFLAFRVRAATRRGLVLTCAGLAEDAGPILAPIGQIRRVERGAFAFKPSGGFVVHLDRSAPFAWAPGVWWRVGKRLGVGGAIRPAEGRAVAELLALEIARRDLAGG